MEHSFTQNGKQRETKQEMRYDWKHMTQHNGENETWIKENSQCGKLTQSPGESRSTQITANLTFFHLFKIKIG